MILMRKLFITLLLFVPCISFAWDGTGHRIIASIAYDQLTPAIKAKVDALSNAIDPGYPAYNRFLYIATLPDIWRSRGQKTWNSWHFVDIPWSTDNTPTFALQNPNLLSGLEQNKILLSDSKATPQQKAQALAFLVHLVGDIHQPLHCISRYSKELPQGDRGGNRFSINYGKITNLHALWDHGASFSKNPHWHYPFSNKRVSNIARQISTTYPKSNYANALTDEQFNDWAQQCFNIAKTVAYQIPKNTTPSTEYLKLVSTTSAQQFALAGYRLAQLLEITLRDKN